MCQYTVVSPYGQQGKMLMSQVQKIKYACEHEYTLIDEFCDNYYRTQGSKCSADDPGNTRGRKAYGYCGSCKDYVRQMLQQRKDSDKDEEDEDQGSKSPGNRESKSSTARGRAATPPPGKSSGQG
ncbi:MAG: hypothetical protein MMC23_001636 [Stictis urceolatum]|nr:hypothetical protein [Stictis urceolata]